MPFSLRDSTHAVLFSNKNYDWANILLDDRHELKALDTFGTEKQIKVHRFTNNLKGLHKIMVKDFSWSIIIWNAWLFEKTLKQYQFSISRFTDLF